MICKKYNEVNYLYYSGDTRNGYGRLVRSSAPLAPQGKIGKINHFYSPSSPPHLNCISPPPPHAPYKKILVPLLLYYSVLKKLQNTMFSTSICIGYGVVYLKQYNFLHLEELFSISNDSMVTNHLVGHHRQFFINSTLRYSMEVCFLIL